MSVQYGSGTRRSGTSWMSGDGVCLRRPRRGLSDAAAEARSVGRGGVMAVCRATRLARSTIERGLKDLDQPAPPAGRVRRAGSGRRRLTAKDPTLLEDLRRLVEPVTLGDPMRPLLWVSKSHVKLAKTLQKMGHAVSPNTVRKLLHQLGYGRRANRRPMMDASMPTVTPSSSTSMPGSWPSRPTISR